MLKRYNNMRMRWSSWLGLGCLLLVIAGSMGSCVQPGKQAERVPAKNCLDCHPELTDKFKQGYVHAPVREDRCDKCHLPHGLLGLVVLRQLEPSLCFTCHRELQPAAEQKSVHKPVADGRCSRCHNPHNSSYPSLLTASKEDTCFNCHEQALFSQKYLHAPLEKGCKTCHDPHMSDNDSLLIKDSDSLCLSCHQADKADFKKAHEDYPVRSKCLLCHTPHSSNGPMLLKKNIHQPVSRGECDSCHTVSKEIISTDKAADDLCFKCHEEPAPDMVSSHKPYQVKKCTACHFVHASDNPVLLAAPEEMICLTCHSPGASFEREEKSATPESKDGTAAHSVHQPVAEGKCILCHKSHDSEQRFLLKQEAGTLCFNCHDKKVFTDNKKSHPTEPEKSCATCHLPHVSKNKSLLIDVQTILCFSCHRKQADERGRLSLHQPFATGQCTSCHSLHKAGEKYFLKKANKNGALCVECHPNVQKDDENIRSHKPVAQGQCEQCHAAHSADFSFIMKEKPGTLCLNCHQKIRNMVQNTSVPHEPAVRENCTACHAAHGSPHEHILKKGQPVLCLACHKETAQYWQDGLTHLPAVKNCMECHSAHGSNQVGMLNSVRSDLCIRCHKIDGKKFLEAHQNISPSPNSCINCHDAHGSPGKGLLYPVGHTPFQEGTCIPCHNGRTK